MRHHKSKPEGSGRPFGFLLAAYVRGSVLRSHGTQCLQVNNVRWLALDRTYDLDEVARAFVARVATPDLAINGSLKQKVPRRCGTIRSPVPAMARCWCRRTWFGGR